MQIDSTWALLLPLSFLVNPDMPWKTDILYMVIKCRDYFIFIEELAYLQLIWLNMFPNVGGSFFSHLTWQVKLMTGQRTTPKSMTQKRRSLSRYLTGITWHIARLISVDNILQKLHVTLLRCGSPKLFLYLSLLLPRHSSRSLIRPAGIYLSSSAIALLLLVYS